jgi:hypothetical protein
MACCTEGSQLQRVIACLQDRLSSLKEHRRQLHACDFLNASLHAARSAGLPRVAGEEAVAAVKGSQWISFDQQTPVMETERMFHIQDGTV